MREAALLATLEVPRTLTVPIALEARGEGIGVGSPAVVGPPFALTQPSEVTHPTAPVGYGGRAGRLHADLVEEAFVGTASVVGRAVVVVGAVELEGEGFVVGCVAFEASVAALLG